MHKLIYAQLVCGVDAVTNQINDLETQGYKIVFEAVREDGAYIARLQYTEAKRDAGGVIMIGEKYPTLIITHIDDQVEVRIVLSGLGFRGGAHTFFEDTVTKPTSWANMNSDLKTAMQVCRLTVHDMIVAIKKALDEDADSVICPIYVKDLDWQAGGWPY